MILDKMLYMIISAGAGTFDQNITNSGDKNSKKSIETLDQRKLLSRCEFFHTRTNYGNVKGADHPTTISV